MAVCRGDALLLSCFLRRTNELNMKLRRCTFDSVLPPSNFRLYSRRDFPARLLKPDWSRSPKSSFQVVALRTSVYPANII